jgi:chromosomal replication initiation ATPase DnaA
MKDNVLVQDAARRCQSEPELAGFPWAIILEIAAAVAKYVIECYMKKQSEPNVSPQQFVASKYANGGYDNRLLASVTRRVHAAARRQGRRLTRDEGRAFARAQLDAIRLGQDAEIQRTIAEYRA